MPGGRSALAGCSSNEGVLADLDIDESDAFPSRNASGDPIVVVQHSTALPRSGTLSAAVFNPTIARFGVLNSERKSWP